VEDIEVFKKFRDVCDEIITAYESENEELLEAALGKFLVLCMKIEADK
jgi:hypothetical protein